MAGHTENKGEKTRGIKPYIRKNGITILLGIGILVMIASPGAKSWVLRQLMMTGIFNARMDRGDPGKAAVPVPGFDFRDEEGRTVPVSSLEGKVVFINFWASWCPPCRAEMPSIRSLYDRYKTNPAVYFLMINEDTDIAVAKAYLGKENYPFPLSRAAGTIPAGIYSGVLPTTLVLDKAGRIRYRHEGFARYGTKKFIRQIDDLIKE